MPAELLRFSDPSDTFISSADIATQVKRLGAEFTQQYAGVDEIIALNVRQGAGAFTWDLIRAIRHPYILYKEIQTGTMSGMVGGDFKLLQDIDIDIEGRDVLLCEDMIDRRVTMSRLLAIFRERKPNSLSVAAMFEKPLAAIPGTKFNEQVSVGMRIANRFVVGYGLDYNDKYRHLPHVTVCVEPKVGEPYPLVLFEPLEA